MILRGPHPRPQQRTTAAQTTVHFSRIWKALGGRWASPLLMPSSCPIPNVSTPPLSTTRWSPQGSQGFGAFYPLLFWRTGLLSFSDLGLRSPLRQNSPSFHLFKPLRAPTFVPPHMSTSHRTPHWLTRFCPAASSPAHGRGQPHSMGTREVTGCAG